MKISQFQAIILAAGRSSRFNTHKSKLSFTLCGQEMIAYPAKLLATLTIPMTFVVGYQQEVIRTIIENHTIPNVTFVEQTIQQGTGHALLCTRHTWHADTLLILNGDIPLVTREIIEELLTKHTEHKAVVSFVTTQSNDAAALGYGRVVSNDESIEIVEARNFTGEDKPNQLLNAGIYALNREFLEQTLPQLTPNEKTGEIYITDLIKAACDQHKKVTTTFALFDYVRGVNTLKELWTAEHIKRSELISYWMHQGVHFSAALNVCIDLDVTIGAGTSIGTGAVLLKGTHIGKECMIDAFSYISNTVVGDTVHIKPHSAICDSKICNYAQVGPFAHLNKSTVEEHAVIGNFVEIQQSTLGKSSTAQHHTYVGNTILNNNTTTL